MEILLLGPVEIRSAGRCVEVGPPQRRAVLAALAADVGRPVPTATLIDRVWGEHPPAQVRSAVHANITHLRRLFAAGEPAKHPRPQVVRQAGGYVLRADQQLTDLYRFRNLARRAQDRGCAELDRATMLRQALDLWRGPALTGVAGEWPERARIRWNMERLDVAVGWAAAELSLRRYDHVIGAVRALLAEFPLAEPLIVLLMRALQAVGRRAEALDHYALTRTRLAEELGADPGSELQALHQEILRGDADRPAPRSPAVTVPALLPMDVHSFTGRRGELAQLDAVRAMTGAHPTAVIVSAVSGTAGVGKPNLENWHTSIVTY